MDEGEKKKVPTTSATIEMLMFNNMQNQNDEKKILKKNKTKDEASLNT